MLVYQYSQKSYRLQTRVLLILWLLILAFRVVLYSIIGNEFIHSTTNIVALWFSGLVIGASIQLLVVRKRSLYPKSEIDKVDVISDYGV